MTDLFSQLSVADIFGYAFVAVIVLLGAAAIGFILTCVIRPQYIMWLIARPFGSIRSGLISLVICIVSLCVGFFCLGKM